MSAIFYNPELNANLTKTREYCTFDGLSIKAEKETERMFCAPTLNKTAFAIRPDKSPLNEISIRETNLARWVSRNSMKEGRKEGQANRRTGVQAGGQDVLGRDGRSNFYGRTSPSSEFMWALAPIPKSRESRPEIALSTWNRPPRPKSTATVHHPRSLSHTRTCDELICKLPYHKMIKGNYFDREWFRFPYKYFALCSLKDYFLRKRRIHRIYKICYLKFSKRAALPASVYNSLKIKWLIKQFFSRVYWYFVSIFYPNYCAQVNSSCVDAHEKARSNVAGQLARGVGEYACAACSIYEQSRINHIQLRTYPFGLSLSPIGRECRPAMQKFAKTATASNFSSTLDITSRCDVPN